MKNLLSILVVLAIATTFSFAQVQDNSGSVKEGTGSFQATVLTPLTIDSPAQVSLGEFVASTTPYTLTNAITFNVTGDPGNTYYFQTEETAADPLIAVFAGSWDLPGDGSTTKVLSGTGTSSHTFTLSSLTAVASGIGTLGLTVTVSYNTF